MPVIHDIGKTYIQFSSCPTLCDPMNCSTPGLPVHHQLPESTQTHVHWVSDAIQPSSVVPFSSRPQSFPESGSVPVRQLFMWGSQSIGVSALASVLPMNTQDWSPLGWTGWIQGTLKSIYTFVLAVSFSEWMLLSVGCVLLNDIKCKLCLKQLVCHDSPYLKWQRELTPTTATLVIIFIKRFAKHLVLLKENRHRSCYLGIQNFEELEVQGLVPISSQSCGGETANHSALVWQ